MSGHTFIFNFRDLAQWVQLFGANVLKVEPILEGLCHQEKQRGSRSLDNREYLMTFFFMRQFR